MKKDIEQNSVKKNLFIIVFLANFIVVTLGVSIITYTSNLLNSNNKGSNADAGTGGSSSISTSKDKTNTTDKADTDIVDNTGVTDNSSNVIIHGSDIGTGEISLIYTESVNGISLKNMMPMTDTLGKVLTDTNEVFEFSINSKLTNSQSIEYEIAIIKNASSTLLNNEVRLYLTQVVGGVEQVVNGPMFFQPISVETGLGSPIGSMVMARVIVNSSSIDKYKLRMWVADDTNISSTSKSFSIKVNVYGKAVM